MLGKNKIILKKVISEINLEFEMLDNVSLENFLEDEKTKRAVAMTAINIGELVKGLTSEFRIENNQVEWKKIAGLSDIISNKYYTVDMEEVYNAVKNEFSELKAQIEKILESEEL